MNQRFQSEEIKRVSEQYAENELYRAISTIGLQMEAELTEFGLCTEECFMEVLELLSDIAGKGEKFLDDIENTWLRKHNEYKRFNRTVDEDEIRKVVGIVFGFAILAVDSSRHPFYRYTLVSTMTQTIASHSFEGWTKTLDTIFSVPLSDGWFEEYIDEEVENRVETEKADTIRQKAGKHTTAKKSGRKPAALFVDNATKESERQRLINYLIQHKMSGRQLASDKNNTLNDIITCFIKEWNERRLLAENFSASAIFRFLTEDCKLSSSVTETSYANKIGERIKNNDYNPSTLSSIRKTF